ncbi:MAG TPA: Uma2 family endonuclease [Candidatus Limnocylindrales bacterium]|nr:Uma2 family endonuclease [Candidatus Limnocylindrales bacterium]
MNRAAGYSSKQYFQLVEDGLLDSDEPVELLDGLIVAKSPQNPRHAATTWRISTRLAKLLDGRAIVRSQLPVIAGAFSVPEPDIAVVPIRDDEWQSEHPDVCMLAVEVADSTLAQDRLTKSRIYAAAGVENYWIANLRSRQVEWFADPDPEPRVYRQRGTASGSDPLPPTTFGLDLFADELFAPVTVADAR